MSETKMMDKLRKLLAQAEGTDNEHEADAFLSQAQLIAAKHSIDLALAKRAVKKAQQRETPIQQTFTIGEAKAMGNARYVELFLAIAKNNDCKVNIAHNSTYVIVFGFPSDIEVTQALYMHLSVQMLNASNSYLKTSEWKNDTYWSKTKGRVPMNAKTARLGFYDGFISRIDSRLTEARLTAIKQTEQQLQEEHSETSAALVLADKKEEVATYYNQTSRARGSWKGASNTGGNHNAKGAGWTAGGKASLNNTKSMPHAPKALSTAS